MMARFSGEPRTEWLQQPALPDRKMRLLEDFWFEDRVGRRWDAPADAVVDGASIPQPLWSIVGSPYTGRYRRGSVVHDVACERAATSAERRAADRMFYEACRVGGCSVEEACILYLGVRIGAIWPAAAVAPTIPRVSKTAADRRVEAAFQLAGEALLRLPPTDEPAEIERRVDEALGAVSALMPT